MGKLLPKMDSMFMLVLMRKDAASLSIKIIGNQTLFFVSNEKILRPIKITKVYYKSIDGAAPINMHLTI